MASDNTLKFACSICRKPCRDKKSLNRHERIHADVKPFACNLCEKQFHAKGDLTVHLSRHAGKVRKRFPCKFCGKSFERNCSLEIHHRIHTNEKPFKCKACAKTFMCKSSRRRHEQIHSSGPKPFKCPICKSSFRADSTYRQHMSVHANPKSKILSCSSCSLKFVGFRYFRTHMRICHGVDVLQCIFCQHKSTRTVVLEEHVLAHIQERPHLCPKCPEDFHSRTSFLRHIKTHNSSREKNVVCELCPTKLYHSSSLRMHIQSHLGEKAFNCDICAKTFLTSPALNRHLKSVHTDNSRPRQFPCGLCHKSYLDKSTLRRHVMTHADEGAHECDLCGKIFHGEISLRNHKIIHSRPDIQIGRNKKRVYYNTNMDEGKLLTCQFCNCRSGSRNQLEAHMRLYHGQEFYYAYECIFCKNKYTRKGEFDKHLRRHIQELSYFCRLCNEGFITSPYLKKHMLEEHSEQTLVVQ